MNKKSYAKLNITLKIVGKENGFHLLESIVCPIDLFDNLKFEISEKDEIISNVEIENNNIFKAINLFKEYTKINKFVKVHLEKNIPIGYGLGSSSANISTTLESLNELFETNLSQEILEKLANKLGSDTVFSLYNKRAFMSGKGEKILTVDVKKHFKFLILLPHKSLLTKDVFMGYKMTKNYHDFKPYLLDNNYLKLHAQNDLLNSAISLNKEIEFIINKGKKHNLNFLMSGSGSALFLIDPTKKERDFVYQEFKEYKVIETKEI